MKLYYAPGACSFAPHVALVEAGIPAETIKVDLRTHKLADGTDYYTISPKGYVPLLELDDGTRLTEVAVLLQYIADRKPGTLAPAFGTIERYHLMEWLNFIATEIHKGFGPLWYPDTPQPTKDKAIATLGKRFEYVNATLAQASLRHGHRVHDRRLLPVHAAQLDEVPQGRPLGVARDRRLHGTRRRAPLGAGGAPRRVREQGLTNPSRDGAPPSREPPDCCP